MHWMLARLLKENHIAHEQGAVHALLDAQFTGHKVSGEVAYLREPSRQTFERPYGWAWLLKLQTELTGLAQTRPYAAPWRDALQPLADLLVLRTLDYLPLAEFPVRAGTHGNSAFALLFMLDYAEATQPAALRTLIHAKAHAWFGGDRQYPAGYEPGGDDFLSGGLMEAALMRRVLETSRYQDWWDAFCPTPQDLQNWLHPVSVTDRSDPKLAHLDGLNLSRAWCWKMIEPAMPQPLRDLAAGAISRHLEASLPHTVNGDYAGTHWLASFATLALSVR